MIRSLFKAVPLVGLVLLAGGAGASQYRDSPVPVGIPVSQPGTAGQVIERCILAAATAYRLPPAVIVILLNVEGGQLGRVSGNINSTVDVGPMQVNEIWLPELAKHWHSTVQGSFLALRDNFCTNIEAGSWILRRGLDEARGDFWTGVGYYHSHAPEHTTVYLRKVLTQALRFQAGARPRPTPPTAITPVAITPISTSTVARGN